MDDARWDGTRITKYVAIEASLSEVNARMRRQNAVKIASFAILRNERANAHTARQWRQSTSGVA